MEVQICDLSDSIWATECANNNDRNDILSVQRWTSIGTIN